MSDKKSKDRHSKTAVDEVASPEDSPGDESPELRAAAEQVEQAREQLRVAQGYYRELRQRTEEQMQQLRGKTVGDVIDVVLDTAKKHPVPSLLAAGALGYFLGRLLRR